jgi:phosphate starvation-inducible protein PhoH
MAKKRENKRLAKYEQEELEEYFSNKETSLNKDMFHLKHIELTPKQLQLMQIISDNKIIIATGAAGTSKAQPLTSKILTPEGWKLMGDIKINDEVISVDGKPTKVLGVFPQGEKEIFEVKFSDGSSTQTTGEHLWLTWNNNERINRKRVNKKRVYEKHPGVIRTTEEMIDTLISYGGRLNYSIPIVKPIEFNQKDFIIDPYLLGALIGDGHLGRYIGFSTNDDEIFNKINNILLKENYQLTIRNENKKFKECAITSINKTNINKIRQKIGELGLLNTLSYTKFIPEQYLFGSIDQRLELLRGLLDTDGWVSRCCIKYSTSSEQLKNDVINLVQSLGGIVKYSISKPVYTYKGKKLQGKDHYNLNLNLPEELAIQCFSLSRKQELVKPRTKYFPIRYITNITKITTAEAQCIMVEDDKHLYITDDYIVTHNTFTSCFSALKLLKNHKFKNIVVTKPTEIVGGTELGHLPGPQPVFSKILTPNGWTTMGEIKKGDYVSTPDGGTAKVLEVFDKGKKDIYEINTLHGKTYACNEHLWSTQTYNEHKQKKPFQVRNTEEISNTLMHNEKINHYLPKLKPIHFDKKDLTIPPYTLGVLLGDGSFCNDNICFASNDNEIVERVKNELSNSFNIVQSTGVNDILYNIHPKNLISRKVGRNVKITNIDTTEEFLYETVGVAYKDMNPDIHISTFQNRCDKKMEIDSYKYEYLPKHKNYTHELKNELEYLSLLGLKSYEKFIPEIYKYSSIEDRIAILQGLMDSDGTCKKNGEASFGTTSKKLANDVIEIVKSLGGNASIRERDRRNSKPPKINNRDIIARRGSYEVYINLPNHINPFHLSRKADRFKTKYMHYNKIESVIKQDEQVECKCILIDHPDHLYITDDFIVTHNTLMEKLAVYMDSFIGIFSELIPGVDLKKMIEDNTIEFRPAQFMRGKTFRNCIVIVDEFQNFDIKTLMAIVTRLGENCTMVFAGDINQNDINKKYVAVNIFKEIIDGLPGTAIFEFTKEDIVRDKLLIDITDRYDKLKSEGKLPTTKRNT